MRVRLPLLSLLVAAACACHSPPHERAADAGAVAPLADWDVARESARAVLENHCSECHDPGSPGALRGAMQVFDLGAVEWSARMSRVQLRDAYDRLGSSVVPTRGDAEALPLHVSDAERATFLHFVERNEAREPRDR